MSYADTMENQADVLSVGSGTTHFSLGYQEEAVGWMVWYMMYKRIMRKANIILKFEISAL